MRRHQPQRPASDSPLAGEGMPKRALIRADRGWHGRSSASLPRLCERDPKSNDLRQRAGSPTRFPEAPENETASAAATGLRLAACRRRHAAARAPSRSFGRIAVGTAPRPPVSLASARETRGPTTFGSGPVHPHDFLKRQKKCWLQHVLRSSRLNKCLKDLYERSREVGPPDMGRSALCAALQACCGGSRGPISCPLPAWAPPLPSGCDILHFLPDPLPAWDEGWGPLQNCTAAGPQ
jgi:hypothetical protein